jgi:hypothetical protein
VAVRITIGEIKEGYKLYLIYDRVEDCDGGETDRDAVIVATNPQEAAELWRVDQETDDTPEVMKMVPDAKVEGPCRKIWWVNMQDVGHAIA